LAFYYSCKGKPLCLPSINFLKNHFLANNWANAWELNLCSVRIGQCSVPSNIYIIFWPQMLEFIGLISIPLIIFWFTRPKR
jgi:hypothetical protein